MADLIDYDKLKEATDGYSELAPFLIKIYPDFVSKYHNILEDKIIVDFYCEFREKTAIIDVRKKLRNLGINLKNIIIDYEFEYAILNNCDWNLIKLSLDIGHIDVIEVDKIKNNLDKILINDI